jgi:acylphosphatase
VVTPVTAVRLTVWVEGRVQGVGFRWWVRTRALELGLTGFAENLTDGRVKVVAEGTAAACEELLASLGEGTGTAVGTGSAGGTSGAGGASEAVSVGSAGRGRYRRPGRVTRVAHRWADATGDMSGFTER